MYKKMLVPLDGSPFAASALEHARAIAKGCDVPEVVLLRVVETVPGYAGMGEDWHNETAKRAKKWTKNYLDDVAESLKKEGVAATTVIAEGDAAGEILDYAGKNKVDLIVMSTHGSSGVVRWLLGSVADRVVRHSVCPVLVISQHELKQAK
jgi:nucleotide-binding universal stress UspA family protein